VLPAPRFAGRLLYNFLKQLRLSSIDFKMRNTFTAVGAALLASTANAQLYPGLSKLNHTCQLQKPLLSCPSQNASDVDSCCVETFGGLVLSTQFWDTYTGLESQGQVLPKDTWSLHGLYVTLNRVPRDVA
jgi:ribonuclease T2